MNEPKTILIIDDSPQNIQAITSFLKENYKVKAATTGERGLALAFAVRPDLVLLDIMMPGIDGYEVCSRLKANPDTADIPVIFLTAQTEVISESQGFDYGAVDYIRKPFDPIIVKARVDIQLALRDAVKRAELAQSQADKLLEIVLPRAAAAELRLTGTVVSRRYDNVVVLFCDLANFTSYCDQHEPEEVVSHLGALFVRFEAIGRRYGLEKIKTIGDAYMAAANLLIRHETPLAAAVRGGIEMLAAVDALGLGWSARVGVHYGPVVAGVVGQERFQFDIWGDTVNVASRMASACEPGMVAMTAATWDKLGGEFEGVSLGEVDIKGKGRTAAFAVRR